MAPIRRYLRITKYSVLEVRIYLHKPSDASWLLSSRGDVLQRVLAAVRPHVLPKLWEENERGKKAGGGAGKKRRGAVRDVATRDDFEVAIFLKDNSTRHSLLTKRKEFAERAPQRIRSTGRKLTGWLEQNDRENPIRIEEEDDGDEEEERPGGVVVREEEAEDEVVDLERIPEVGRKRKAGGDGVAGEQEQEDGDGDDGLFVSSSDEEFFATQRRKRRKTDENSGGQQAEAERDDKKKLAMNTSYDGFSIYGRVLCLIVQRKGKTDTAASASVGGSQMMEQWVSTQVAQEAGIPDDDG